MALSGIIKFTTTIANENILQNTAIKTKIKELKGNISEENYQQLFILGQNGEFGGLNMKFSIIFPTDNKVLINNQVVYNDTMESVFDSQGYQKVYAVKIQTPAIATIMISIN